MIKIFKMNSGEEIVTEAEKIDGSWMFSKPMALVQMQSSSSGEISLAIMPWLLADKDGTIRVKEISIAGEYEKTPIMVEEDYLQRTSGISIAKSVPQQGIVGM